TETDVGCNQGQSRLRIVRHAGAIGIDEGARVQVGLPLVDADFTHVTHGAGGVAAVAAGRTGRGRARCAGSRRWHTRRARQATHPNALRDAVDDLVVPLVECRELPVTRGDVLEIEAAVGIALREGDFGAIRVAQADVALCERERVTAAARIQ